MSLLGKILAIVNIFAVLGTLALLGMNYAKRQSWEYSVFRHDLMINGLPLNDQETNAQQQAVASLIGTGTQQDLFRQTSPATPVATQEAEVARVQQDLRNKFQNVGDKKKQMWELAGILKPMADTIEERGRMVAYQTYLKDDKSFGVLKARLQAAHKAATAPQQPGQDRPYEARFRDALAVTFSDPPGPFGEEFLAVMKAEPNANFEAALEKSLDNELTQLNGQFEQMFKNVSPRTDAGETAAEQRKRGIARLLFNMVDVLTPDAKQLDHPAYRRLFVVVGVKSALEAINAQANVLQGLVFETGADRLRERYLFAEEHRKLVDQALAKKAEVDEHRQVLAQRKKEADIHADKVAARRNDVRFYEQQLAAVRRETAQHLAQLRQVSDQLFAERVKLRDNSEDNQKLEKQIRALESGR